MTELDRASLDRILPSTPGPANWEDVLRRSDARRGTRRRRLVALAAAGLVIVVGTASAIGGVREFFFTPGVNSKIAYIQNPRPGAGGDKELWVMNADGSEPKRLSRIASYGRPAWSPDETKIAFVRGLRAIYVVNVDGSGQRRLAGAAGHATARPPVWSPDGRKIAFAMNRPGRYADIYVISPDGNGLRNLTRTPEIEGFPAWSPDGRRIAFWRFGDDWPNNEIYVMNADGSGQRRLWRDTSGFVWFRPTPAWSPDGRKLVFSAGARVYVMNADGSELRKITRGVFPEWSPDGRKIAFIYDPRFTSGTTGSGRTPSSIHVMNADGSGRRKLGARPNPDNPLAWSPDGRKIAFVGDHEIWVVNADGSGLHPLTRTRRANWEPSWSPGRQR
jgi:TolB protein